jgi:hypothetical protein
MHLGYVDLTTFIKPMAQAPIASVATVHANNVKAHAELTPDTTPLRSAAEEWIDAVRFVEIARKRLVDALLERAS